MGLFKQVFNNNLQNEEPNPWMSEHSWMTKTEKTYQVDFGGFNVQSRMYDIDVTGYDSVSTKLHLFDVETVDESIIKDGINFDKAEFTKNLTLFLYPDDSDDNGRLLRVYQQYFMVSNAAQLILDEAVEKGSNLYDLADYAVIQINDTHPSMVIPELVRLLKIRRNVQESLEDMGADIVSLVHPAATVAYDVQIGAGTVVMAGAVINPSTVIGKGCIINTSASVDHDNVIGDYCHISVGAHTAGTVNMGDNCWLGIGGIVSNNIDICADTFICAGGVVVKNITKPGKYAGIPARIVPI